MPSILTAAPAEEPVTLAELKATLRLDGSDEDALLASLILAARQHVEQLTRLVLIEQSWRLYLDAWPRRMKTPPYARRVVLEIAPVKRVTNVTIYDGAGAPQSLDPALYRLDNARRPAALIIEPAIRLPGLRGNGIEIDVEAGFGSATDVPTPLRQAILRLATLWFEHRHDADITSLRPTPPTVDALIAPYRVLS